jgi:hypothetical protein
MTLRNYTRLDLLQPDPEGHAISCTAAAGDTSIISAGEGDSYRIRAIAFTVGGADTITIKSGSTTLGSWDFPAAGDGIVLPDGDCGWFDTAAGEDFIIHQTTGVGVKGVLRAIQLEG